MSTGTSLYFIQIVVLEVIQVLTCAFAGRKVCLQLTRGVFAAVHTKLAYFCLLLRLTHPEGPYGSTATSSTNNPEFVEDLSQGQLLQSESSNAADGSEQRHEDEVSWNLLSLSSGASKATACKGLLSEVFATSRLSFLGRHLSSFLIPSSSYT